MTNKYNPRFLKVLAEEDKSEAKDKPILKKVYTEPLPKLLSEGHVIIKSNFEMRPATPMPEQKTVMPPNLLKPEVPVLNLSSIKNSK